MEPGRTQHHFKSALRHRLHRHARRGVEAFHGRIHLQKRFFHRSPVLQSQPDAADICFVLYHIGLYLERNRIAERFGRVCGLHGSVRHNRHRNRKACQRKKLL